MSPITMNSLTPLKSNCSKALEQCIRDCQQLVVSHKEIPGLEKCVELAQLCIGACAECLDACESARLDRGKMMLTCAEACKIFAAECEKHNSDECKKCVESCRNCLEEFEHVLA